MSAPRVSVHVMVYNSARYLEHCIQSLRSQTFADFEVLMVDAGSRDRSPQICAAIQRQDARFMHLRREDYMTIGRARAEALAHSRGEYVAILDSDDWARPNRLAAQVAWLDSNRDTVLLASYYRVVNALNVPTRVWPIHFHEDIEIRWRIIFGNCLTHSSVMYRRAAAQGMGGYDASLPTGEDMDFYGRMLDQGKFHVLDQPLVYYRTHAESLSQTEPVQIKETFTRLVKNAIQRQLNETVDIRVAAAVYNQSYLPAAGADTARQSLDLLRGAHAKFESHVAKSPQDRKLLGRTVFLHLLQFMTKNSAMSWWPTLEKDWQRLLVDTARKPGGYDWRRDAGLLWHGKNILKSAPRALWLALN